MYKKPLSAHCESCPANSAADPNNPHVCIWQKIELYPAGRQRVIKLVQRLMHNNEHPWCGFDRHFRLLVVRAAARAVMHIQHGNEEHYHDRSNEPANFRRSRLSANGETLDHRGSETQGSPPLQHLATDAPRNHAIQLYQGEAMNIRARENFDVDFMNDQSRWPMVLFLPLKRRQDVPLGSFPWQCGIMTRNGYDVLLTSIDDFLEMSPHDRTKVERLTYASAEAAFADGWLVD